MRTARALSLACRAWLQVLSVSRAGSAGLTVAVQLSRSFSPFSEREPGSAV